MPKNDAIIGISDHGGWAVLVTVAADGTLLDRRRAELVDEDLPKIPHHSEAQRLPLDKAVALVERVQASVERHAKLALDAVAVALAGRANIVGVALRQCPELPPTIAERIKDYRAQNNADWVMYRRALAAAAVARGWAVHWYAAKKVLGEASHALGSSSVSGSDGRSGGHSVADFDAHFLQLRKSIGPPWNNDHKLAMAAAMVALAVVAATVGVSKFGT